MVRESELSISQAIGIIEAEMNSLSKYKKSEDYSKVECDKYNALKIALMQMQNNDNQALLNLKEFCEYTGLGMTKAREILKRQDSTFTVRIGNRLYANKKLFDEHLDKCAKYQIPI